MPAERASHIRPRRRMLVIWRWEEAEDGDGDFVTGSVGGHMKYARKGDALYLCAVRGSEVYLLGSILVRKVGLERRAAARRKFGPYTASGDSRFGQFGIFPLGQTKWRLRFEGSEADRLRRGTPLGLQLRARRYLTAGSARLLDDVLKQRRERRERNLSAFRLEGQRIVRAMSLRKRDSVIRRLAIRRYGRVCQICGLDMVEEYGRFARNCVEVHHLDPIGERSRRGARTVLDEVIVVCPTCHRALHCFDDPAAWKRFKVECGFD